MMDKDIETGRKTTDKALTQSEITRELEKKKASITAIENKIIADKAKLEKLQDRHKALEHRGQLKENRDTYKERKARTHKLIGMGALAEKYLDIHTVDELEYWLKKYVDGQKNNDLLTLES